MKRYPKPASAAKNPMTEIRIGGLRMFTPRVAVRPPPADVTALVSRLTVRLRQREHDGDEPSGTPRGVWSARQAGGGRRGRSCRWFYLGGPPLVEGPAGVQELTAPKVAHLVPGHRRA